MSGTVSGTATGTGGAVADRAHDLAAASLTLARRFAAAATLWCGAPTLPHHALHVSAGFGYPAISGKRALSARMLPGPTLVPALRVLARPGDVLVAIAAADDPLVGDAMRRASAWGLTTIWIGAGPRPRAGAADHVLWLDEVAPVEHSEALILTCHLLWELTHICLEHPALLRERSECTGPTCITCSDAGRLVEVAHRDADGDAIVRTATGIKKIDTMLVGEVSPGDLLVVHAGSAIARYDEALP